MRALIPESDLGVEPLVEMVRERLARDRLAITPAAVAGILRAEGRPVGDATVLAVHDLLQRDVEGAGVLQPLLELDGVTDVLVNGPDEVWIDRGGGLERSGVRFTDESAVRRLAQRLAGQAGRRLDDASPWADLRLPGGARFHAVLAPVARPGTLISLRIPSRQTFSLDDWQRSGSLSEVGRAVLDRLLASRAAFLVSGGTPPDGKQVMEMKPRPWLCRPSVLESSRPYCVDILGGSSGEGSATPPPQ